MTMPDDDFNDLLIINVPINNHNYEYIFPILAKISDCEEKIRQENATSEGYYVKFRYDDPDGLIVTIDNGHMHFTTFYIKLSGSMISRHIVNVIFGINKKKDAEYNVFVRMTGNIRGSDFKCRLFLYNNIKKFRINFVSASKAELRRDVIQRADESLKNGSDSFWLNEHLVGSYV